MRSAALLAAAASIAACSASGLQGFNYGSTKSDGSFQMQSDFEALFAAAKKVTNGFNSARLYTTIVRFFPLLSFTLARGTSY